MPPLCFAPLFKEILTEGADSPYDVDYQDDLGNLGYDAYNTLFDTQAALKEGGIHFPIWNEDGSFNASGMVEIFNRQVDEFEAKYAPYFSVAGS
ncbi:MAG: hypothetical protein C0514_00330 [Candidatus Puniceispirillum sp.]|nr:hypothetical protein [Candidatus Puniceispirillum sp.]